MVLISVDLRSRRPADHYHVALANFATAVAEDLKIAIPLAELTDFNHVGRAIHVGCSSHVNARRSQ